MAALLPAAAWAGPSIPPSTCSTSDLNLTIGSTIYSPTQCAHDILSPPQTLANETSHMNTAFGVTFTGVANINGGGSLDGIAYTISAPKDVTSGQFVVTWADTNPPGKLTLPVVEDLEIGIDGGANGDGYLFRNVILPATPNSGTGQFTITFFNNGGNNPGLSGISMAVGDDVACTASNGCGTTTQHSSVPEPATIALLGFGLLGLGLARRRAN